MSKKTCKVINFETIARRDIKNIDSSDPKILKQLGIDPLPDFDDVSSMDDDEIDDQYMHHKSLYMKILAMAGALEYQREEIFTRFKNMQEEKELRLKKFQKTK